jgi:mannan endo-1,4-beta-mannosidase
VRRRYPLYWETPFDHPGSNVTLAQWGAFWVQAHATAAAAAGKPLVLEEFGYTGVQNRTEIYPLWVGTALATGHAGVMPWCVPVAARAWCGEEADGGGACTGSGASSA